MNGLDDLKIYQMAETRELEIHELTKSFPHDEQYRSVDQLRRSSTSVTNNIAEAYRKQTTKEQVHILKSIAIGEIEETRTNIVRCGKKGLCDVSKATSISNSYLELIKATHGYIRYLNRKEQNSKLPHSQSEPHHS